jgi:serine/threonine protein kinase
MHAMDSGELCDKDFLQLLAELCLFLDQAQTQCQFMHRDMKPNNLFYQTSAQSRTVALTMPGTSLSVVFEEAWLQFFVGDFGMSSAVHVGQRIGADTWHDGSQFLPSLDILTLFLWLYLEMFDDLQTCYPGTFAVIASVVGQVENLAADLPALQEILARTTSSAETSTASDTSQQHEAFLVAVYRLATKHGASTQATPRMVFKAIADMYGRFKFAHDVNLLNCFGPTSYARLAAISAHYA